MARYRRYRRYRRKSGRWSANIDLINDTSSTEGEGRMGNSITIAQNPAQTNQGVSQAFTVKNVEVSAHLESINPNYINGIIYYIMYVPQGYGIDVNLPKNHPEWIMAYKYIGDALSSLSSTANTSQAQPPTIRTRLARKLQSGDSIVFLYTFDKTYSDTYVNINMKGLVRWWTKAN